MITSPRRTRLVPLFASLLFTPVCPAQWESLNPGAGGQIQNINLDPNRPGRAFFSSDMEGNYRTDDYGATWHYIGHDLSGSNSLVVTVEPGNSDRVYAGTNVSLEVSDNGGRNWRAAPEVLGHPIREILVDPTDVRLVYALVGMRENYDGMPTPGIAPFGGPAGAPRPAVPGGRSAAQGGAQGRPASEDRGDRNGPGYLFVSRDRGATWERVLFDPADGHPQNYSLSLDPSQPRVLYLAARRGLFVSRDGAATWEPMPGPEGAGACWGADVSPDGSVVYATYTREGQLTQLWATRTDRRAWVNLSVAPAQGFQTEGGRANYWRPKVDPRSTGKVHRLLTASTRARTGLWEVTVDWSDTATPSARWERILFYSYESQPPSPPPFDAGWERYTPRPLYYSYAPVTWPRREIWSTGDQTLFAVDTARDEWTSRWENKYSRPVQVLDGVPFHAHRGMASTFVFDGDAHGAYNVQANADNAVLESYDHGHSWTIGLKQARSNAVAIVKQLAPAIVVAHTSPGYGAGATQGSLWAKRLIQRSPLDHWVRVGGGPELAAGLPNTLYRQIEADPHRPGRLYIGTSNQGIYVVEDIRALLDAAEKGVTPPTAFRLPGSPDGVAERGENLFVDPRRDDTLWVAANDAPYRGVRGADGSWTWTRLRDRGSNLAVWSHQGRVMLATQAPGPDGQPGVHVSSDEGASWRWIGGFGEVRSLRSPAWYREGMGISSYGLTGHGPNVFISFGVFAIKRPYGIFRATLADDGTATWEDFTGDKVFPLPVKAKVVDNEGRAELYLATWGTGWWRRKL